MVIKVKISSFDYDTWLFATKQIKRQKDIFWTKICWSSFESTVQTVRNYRVIIQLRVIVEEIFQFAKR